MVRHTDRPLRIVRVSFETTRFSAEHLIDAYACVAPTVRRPRLAPRRVRADAQRIKQLTAKRRRGEP
jgi:hypothetical protein